MAQTLPTKPLGAGGTPALCMGCRHRREADRSALDVLKASVGSPQALQELNKLQSEVLTQLRQEDLIAETKQISPLVARPRKYDWCWAQSDLDKGRYWFCSRLETDTCSYFEPRGTAANAAPGAGATAKPLDAAVDVTLPGAPVPGADAAATNGAPAAATELAVEPAPQVGPAPSPTVQPAAGDGWRLVLGEASALRATTIPLAIKTGGFRVDYELVPIDEEPAIANAGLNQTYLIFGGPGAGKTHYFKYLLSQLLAHPRRPGCLLLDPKGVLTPWLHDVLESIPGRSQDLAVLSAGTTEHKFNVLGDDLPAKEIGRLLTEVVLAGAAGIDEGWQVLIGDLLESAAVVLKAREEVRPDEQLTVASLLKAVLYRRSYPTSGREYPIVVMARGSRISGHPDPDVRIAADRIADYFASTEDRQRRFVRQIIERTLAEMVSPDWDYLSSTVDSTESGSSFYKGIIDGHRVATVAVGQGSPAFQRSLSTLVKALFQQAVLANLSKNSGQRPFFILACDEYAQAITEGDTGLVSDSRFFSLSREAGCLSLLALQSIATGRSRFPAAMKDRWDGILGNVTVKFFMRLNDIETAELGSNLAGSQHSFLPVVSTGLSQTGTSLNEGVTMLEHKVVPPWYLTNRMPQGAALVHGTLDGVSPPTSCFVKVDPLARRTFVSVLVTDDGMAKPLVDGTRLSMAFRDRRLLASAGCRTYTGGYRVESGRLVLDGPTSTVVACDPVREAQDRWLLAFLESAPSVDVAGFTLTLRSGSVVIELLDEAAAPIASA